jgi:hypothetical protein
MTLTPVGRRGTLQIKEVKVVYDIFLIEAVKRSWGEATTRCPSSLHGASLGGSVSQVEIGHPSFTDGAFHIFFTDNVQGAGKAC